MDWKEISVIVAVLTGAAALVRTIYATTYQYALLQTGLAALLPLLPLTQAHESWMKAMEVKINTMWDFQLRRGEAEAIARGVALRQSPLAISPEARTWIASLAQDLQRLYHTFDPSISDNALALAIEEHYGDALVETVCIPHGLTAGACLIIALAVAKEGQKSA